MRLEIEYQHRYNQCVCWERRLNPRDTLFVAPFAEVTLCLFASAASSPSHEFAARSHRARARWTTSNAPAVLVETVALAGTKSRR